MKKYKFKSLLLENVELTIETYGFAFAIASLGELVQDVNDWELVTRV